MTYWTTKEQRIIRDHAGKEPLAMLAARVGRTPEAVKRYANVTMGVSVAYHRKPPPIGNKGTHPEHLRAKAKALRDSGLGLMETARQLGVSHTYVWRWADKCRDPGH